MSRRLKAGTCLDQYRDRENEVPSLGDLLAGLALLFLEFCIRSTGWPLP